MSDLKGLVERTLKNVPGSYISENGVEVEVRGKKRLLIKTDTLIKPKKELIRQLDVAIELGEDLNKQIDEIGKILEDQKPVEGVLEVVKPIETPAIVGDLEDVKPVDIIIPAEDQTVTEIVVVKEEPKRRGRKPKAK